MLLTAAAGCMHSAPEHVRAIQADLEGGCVAGRWQTWDITSYMAGCQCSIKVCQIPSVRSDSYTHWWVTALTMCGACRLELCQVFGAALDALAERFPGTKFLRIVSTDCIPG
jgi:hypothetical protein